MIKERYHPLKDRSIAVLGLAFKAGTDDMRESPAIHIVRALVEEGGKIKAFDPQALQNAQEFFGQTIAYSSSVKEALENATLALILTEWKEFKNVDYSGMKEKNVFDTRKIVNTDLLSDDVEYDGLCW